MLLPGKIRVGRVGVLQLQRWFIVVDTSRLGVYLKSQNNSQVGEILMCFGEKYSLIYIIFVEIAQKKLIQLPILRTPNATKY